MGEDREVRVPLGAPIETVHEIDWPARADGGGADVAAAIQEEVELRIEMPDGDPFVAPSRLTFVHQELGRVVSVSLLPLEERLDLADAVAEVRDLLARNRVLTDDLDATFDEWAVHEAPDGEWPLQDGRLRTGTQVRDVEVDIELRERDGAGWFAEVVVSLPIDQW